MGDHEQPGDRKRTGRRVALTPARRMVAEIMRESMRVPTLVHSQMIDVSPLVDLRPRLAKPISWLAIMARAYGLTGQRHPELRQAYIRWPYPRLYEHYETVCAVPVEREWRGEQILLFPLIKGPEHQTLPEILNWLQHFKQAPADRIGRGKTYLRYGWLPWIFRRIAFWHSLHVAGPVRARRFGTCVMSSLGDLHCEQVTVLTPLTSYFTFGPIDDQCRLRASIAYDHRVMDGRAVARCLNTLAATLQGQMPRELEQLAGDKPDAAAARYPRRATAGSRREAIPKRVD